MLRPPVEAAAARAGVPPLEGNVYLPLYRRLHDTFARMIAEGRWKPGDGLPAETEIARSYRIAAGTVRRAMDELAGSGLIERRHGLGTFVRRPNFDNAMLRFFQFRDASGAPFVPESRIVRRALGPCPGVAADALGLGDSNAVHLVRHRLWDGAVRLIEDIHLPPDRFSALLDAATGEIGALLYPAYERLCGQVVFAISEDIEIGEAEDCDAAHLGLPPGSLVFRITRVARNALGAAIEWRISRGDARRFRYQVSLAARETQRPG
jgi:GntR family transcriptional regulator